MSAGDERKDSLEDLSGFSAHPSADKIEAVVEADLAEYLSDGNLDDAELGHLADELVSLDSLPDEERREKTREFLAEFHREVVRVEKTNGLLPPPTMLAGYEDVLPGAADRILRMAESQQAHRIDIETRVVKGNIVSERIGTILGGLLAIVLIVGAIYLIQIGKSLEGLSLVVAEAAGLVTVFRRTSSNSVKELEAKKEQADSNNIQEKS